MENIEIGRCFIQIVHLELTFEPYLHEAFKALGQSIRGAIVCSKWKRDVKGMEMDYLDDQGRDRYSMDRQQNRAPFEHQTIDKNLDITRSPFLHRRQDSQPAPAS